MTKTTIEWATDTWNPIRARRKDGTGKVGWACVRVSPGCTHCYAATQNRAAWAGGTGLDYTVPDLAKVDVYLDEKTLDEPRHWRKPRRVFVCSMTDAFGEWLTPLDIARLLNIAGSEPEHEFLFLTKRAERMQQIVRAYYEVTEQQPFPNVWLGVSVENQAAADERIPHLLATPAAVRFLSCEPLLGPIDLTRTLTNKFSYCTSDSYGPSGHRDCPKLHWVIVGGESGPRARPFDLAWARSLRDQCAAAGVSFFMKQLGSWPCDHEPYADEDCGRQIEDAPMGGVYVRHHLSESHGRDMSEWPEDLRVREWPR